MGKLGQCQDDSRNCYKNRPIYQIFVMLITTFVVVYAPILKLFQFSHLKVVKVTIHFSGYNGQSQENFENMRYLSI